MGQRYRFTFAENGDVLDPISWVEDNNELASEVNGYLDRDNFGRGDIAQNEITANAFTYVEGFASEVPFTPDQTAIGWQGGAGNGANGIFNQEVTCEVDCLLAVEFNVTWTWDKAISDYSITGTGGSDVPPWSLSTYAVDTIQFRIVVDGVEVARSGLFEDMHYKYGTYLVGAKVVTAGLHTVSVECAVNHRRWEGLGQDGTCTYPIDIENRCMVCTQERR